MLLPLIQSAYGATLWPKARSFHRALGQPEAAQQALLSAILTRNTASLYGREHGFAGINQVADFQQQIPICDYDHLSPWIERIAAGEPMVLTTEPVKILERTSGSSGSNKLIPYTQPLLDDFSRAIHSWQFKLLRHYPGLLRTTSYWSISPLTQGPKQTEGGIPIGFEDETEYFNPLLRWALNQCFAVPQNVRQIQDQEQWQLSTCCYLLEADNLGFISVWSPTFLLSLLDFMVEQASLLSQHLSRKARRRLQQADLAGRCDTRQLWPHLQLISCWTDGISQTFVAELRRYFPQIPIQGKGLLATEGVVTIPHQLPGPGNTSQGGVLAVNSHFYEFIDIDNPEQTPLLPTQLRQGGLYSPLITTGGGFYRYHLKDVVRCEGWLEHTPVLAFVGKYDRISDVCGEKLNAAYVETCLRESCRELGLDVDLDLDFAMLAPVISRPAQYRLYVESDHGNSTLESLCQVLEQRLCQSHHYGYARQLGQLLPLRWQRVTNAWENYQQTLVAAGMRVGDIKPTVLDCRHPWDQIFAATPPCR